MRAMSGIKYWWSDDREWFRVFVDDGVNQATASLSLEQAQELSAESDPKWAETLKEGRRRALALLEKARNGTLESAALATLSPPAGERREAIARTLWETHDGSKRYPWAEMIPYDRECYYKYADALFASGLVQDEAAIRADEREKCAKIADREAEFWQDAESSSARIVAANIRSARDGGEGR